MIRDLLSVTDYLYLLPDDVTHDRMTKDALRTLTLKFHALPRNLALSLILALFLAIAPALEAWAQRGRISLIRDAEIEALIRDYARPLMKAAGLKRGAVRFYIVDDPSFNAFVNGRGLFVNTGLILQAETPDEVIGVVAHELGHIVGGHQIRLRERLDRAMQIAKYTSLLGLGIGIAGAASGEGNVGSAGLALAAGSRGFAMRDVLKYQRGEEAAADRTAVELLRKTKQSGKGMLQTFKRLGDNIAYAGRRINPYTLSHPLPTERVAALKQLVTSSPYYNRTSSASLRARHDMARAKLAAYIGGDRYSRALLSGKQLGPTARLYGRAITTHLYGSPKKAVPMIDRLLKKYPKNAYLHEMKGEILLRAGKARQAVAPFRRAVKLDRTGAGFIRVELGHALLQSGDKKSVKEAVTQLRKGVQRDPTATAGYRYLARAYARLGDEPRAQMATAEHAWRTGQKKRAKSFAKRAQKSFKRGTPNWLRAEDIINSK